MSGLRQRCRSACCSASSVPGSLAHVPTPVRLHNLDYLRGIAAIGVMFFHLGTWWLGEYSPNSFMGRVGVYAVAIFYVLSGLTLYHVYSGRMRSGYDLRNFFVQRAFRIFPLLWIVTVAALLVRPRHVPWSDLLMSLTGVFGFVSWDTYFSAGIWSIGNELVFYVLFPIIIALILAGRATFVAVGVLFGITFLIFAFVNLSSSVSISKQWYVYINPGNQVFLFFIGITIGYLGKVETPRLGKIEAPRNSFAWILLILGGLLFMAWPIETNSISGWSRVALTVSTAAICGSAYFLRQSIPRFVHQPLNFLGVVSYSIYLLHPIVNELVRRSPIGDAPAAITIPAVVCITITASWVTNRLIEQPMTAVGRRFVRNRLSR